jgi:hypothetical protein
LLTNHPLLDLSGNFLKYLALSINIHLRKVSYLSSYIPNISISLLNMLCSRDFNPLHLRVFFSENKRPPSSLYIQFLALFTDPI